MDSYFEHIVKKEKDTKSRLKTLAFWLIYIFCLFLLMMFSAVLAGFTVIVFAGITWGFVLLLKSQNLEFESVVVNEYIDIDKIIDQRKRKRLASFNVRTVFVLAKPGSQYDKEPYEKSIIAGNADSKNAYCAVCDINGRRTRVVFELTKEQFDFIKKYNPMKIHGE